MHKNLLENFLGLQSLQADANDYHGRLLPVYLLLSYVLLINPLLYVWQLPQGGLSVLAAGCFLSCYWLSSRTTMVLLIGAVLLLSPMLSWQTPALDATELVFSAMLIAVLSGALGYISRRCLGYIHHLKQRDASLQRLLPLTEALLRINRDGVTLLSAEGRLILANQRGLALMQAEQVEQVRWKDWLQAQSAHASSLMQQAWTDALNYQYGDFTAPLSFNAVPQGVWHVMMTPVMQQADKHLMLVISRDVSSSVSYQQQLQNTAAELSYLLDSLNHTFIALDKQHCIRYMNVMARQLLVATDDNVSGQPVLALLPGEFSQQLAPLLAQGSAQPHSQLTVAVAEHQRWWQLELDTTADGFNLILRDITKEYQQQQQLRQAVLRSELAEELQAFGSWEYELGTHQMTLSDQACKILEIKPVLQPASLSLMTQLLHPQDRLTFTRALLDVAQSATRFTFAAALTRSSGETTPVRIALRCLTDGQGKADKIIGSIQDISQQKAKEDYLSEAERFVRSIIDTIPYQLCVIDQAGTLINVNQAWLSFAGAAAAMTSPLARGANYIKVCEKASHNGCKDATAVLQGLLAVINAEQNSFSYEYSLTHQGQLQWFCMHVQPLQPAPAHGAALFVVSHQNITQYKQLLAEHEAQQERLSFVYQASSEGFWDFDTATDRFTYVSPSLQRLWQCNQPPESGIDLHWLKRKLVAEDVDKLLATFNAVVAAKSQGVVEYRIKTGMDKHKWLSTRCYAVSNSAGKVIRLVGNCRDVTAFRLTQQQLQVAVQLDSLSGLPNRAGFNKQITALFNQPDSSGKNMMLAIVNLDRFTDVNESLGYEMGDVILQQVAARLQTLTIADGLWFRISGDEFALLTAVEQRDTALPELLGEIMAKFTEPFIVSKHKLFVSASVGAACKTAQMRQGAELLRQADIALQQVKQKGGGYYQLCQQTLVAKLTLQGLHLESELHQAFELGQFELHYQLKVAASSGLPLGCEALLRWRHPVLGLISPAEFIPQLESSGLIIAVGDWILDQGLRQLKQWHDAGFSQLALAINVSTRQVCADDLASTVQRLLARHAIDARYLELELTETTLMTDIEQACQLFATLKAMGVSLAVDDFGTGYSSLNYLRSFKPDTIKIDKQFIDDLEHDVVAVKIVKSIVQLATELKINVVAEGVETEAQWTLLRTIGCPQLQGYYFARPLPAEAFSTKLLSLSQSIQQPAIC